MVGAEPLRWFERQPSWVTAPRAPKGGALRIDVEVWKVRARIGRNSRTPLLTFELVLGQDREAWRSGQWTRSRPDNLVGPSGFGYLVIVKAMLETIETGAVKETVVECQDYTAGFQQLQRTVPEGARLLWVRPER